MRGVQRNNPFMDQCEVFREPSAISDIQGVLLPLASPSKLRTCGVQHYFSILDDYLGAFGADLHNMMWVCRNPGIATRIETEIIVLRAQCAAKNGVVGHDDRMADSVPESIDGDSAEVLLGRRYKVQVRASAPYPVDSQVLAGERAIDGLEKRVGEGDGVGACLDVDAVDGTCVRVCGQDEVARARDRCETVELD